MKEIKDMSNDELREYLDDIRLSRRRGFDRTTKIRAKKQAVPDCLKNIDDNLATLVLAELAKRK